MELGKEYDVRSFIFDVQDVEAIKNSFSKLKKVDCLVNAAGISIKKTAIESVEEADWDITLGTNVKS